jgi:two-component system, chemotaxis family, chemotaxis protein CheY
VIAEMYASPRTCLVVDDSRVMRKVALRIVEQLDFEGVEAADGLEALTYCRASMPDAILLDWAMPVMDGLEFLKQLRMEPDGDHPVVVFCTAETRPAQIRMALDQGAAEFIMKPFDGDIIASKFEEVGLI